MTSELVAQGLAQLGLTEAEESIIDMPRLQRSLEVGCMPCVHASMFGHWGPPLYKDIGAWTHCKRCHRSWRSIKEAHCVVCCQQFASNEAAAYHWVDDKHIDPAEVKRAKKVGGGPRYHQLETEFGPVWILARHIEYRERTQ